MCDRYVSPEEAEIELTNARWGLIPGWWKEPPPPHFFHLPDNQMFAFAGVMAMWKPANDDPTLAEKEK